MGKARGTLGDVQLQLLANEYFSSACYASYKQMLCNVSSACRLCVVYMRDEGTSLQGEGCMEGRR